MTSDHADLLNELDAMQHSLVYALRRSTLAEAENLIVSQEREIKRLQARIAELETSTAPAT